MSKSPAKVRWEFSDTTLWVSFGPNDKPFPVTIFRRQGTTDFQVHPNRHLTEEENQLLLDFMSQCARDLTAMWPEAFANRLTWSVDNLKKKSRKRRKP